MLAFFVVFGVNAQSIELASSNVKGEHGTRTNESTISPVTLSYVVGSTMDLVFQYTYSSPDAEWVDGVSIQFPAGVSVNSATACTESGTELAYNGETGDGALSSWGDMVGGSGYGALHTTGTFSVNVTIEASFSGAMTLDWTIAGDGYGSAPHTNSGSFDINEAVNHDLGVDAVTPTFVLSGSTVTPQVTVHNYGASDETAYTVVLNDGTSDISTVNVSTTITSGTDAVIDMDPWTPADGNYTLTATVTVTDDANAANDQMTSDVEVRAIGFGDIVMTFDADAAGCPGIETDGNFIYTAYWNTGSAGRYFDRYDMDGNFVEGFEVSGAVDVRDMAYNPNTGYFYGAAANTSLFEMDFTQGSEALVSTITAATDCRAIAYDDDDDTFWGNNWDSPLTEFDITGTATSNTMAVTSQYGAAYDNWTDSENPTIWGFSSDGGTPANTLIEYGMDGTLTGRTIDISSAPGFNAGIGGGLASYEENGVAYLLADIQQDPNLIVKIYLAATTPPVSVSDIAAQGINVFPNPSNGVFNISVENNYNLEVSDITGRVISTKTLTGNTSIELNTAGVYFLRFSNEKGSYTEKVIVK